MSNEVELAGGVMVVKAENPPAPTEAAAQAGHDPSLTAREPSAEQTAKGALA
jgi:hypothetical protein